MVHVRGSVWAEKISLELQPLSAKNTCSPTGYVPIKGLDPSKDPVYVGWVLHRLLKPQRPEVSSCGLGRSSLTAGKAGEASRQLLRRERKTLNTLEHV
ncbi:hypothetical protein ATANTOWER_024629 [Ataeniobius toweri]|uniref:Uncharacterized protein n=1 Tax=Ataeniobius toweri TaxID=208326 RepID=A0ABU7ATA3_9TELE|nr:hypothetical protein [Ataeniobius toweri]